MFELWLYETLLFLLKLVKNDVVPINC